MLGEQFKLANLPLAIINPSHSEFSQATFGSALTNLLEFEILTIIRESEPKNWFKDIVTPMCQIFDAIITNRTLNGKVEDCIPRLFEPGEIRMVQRLYYGGVIRFQARLTYTPS